jgi:hypothetical protein
MNSGLLLGGFQPVAVILLISSAIWMVASMLIPAIPTTLAAWAIPLSPYPFVISFGIAVIADILYTRDFNRRHPIDK